MINVEVFPEVLRVRFEPGRAPASEGYSRTLLLRVYRKGRPLPKQEVVEIGHPTCWAVTPDLPVIADVVSIG